MGARCHRRGGSGVYTPPTGPRPRGEAVRRSRGGTIHRSTRHRRIEVPETEDLANRPWLIGLVRPPAVVLDGDPRLRLRAGQGVPAGVEVLDGRIGHVEAHVHTGYAWESLAAAGYASVSAQLDPWREAAAAVGGTVLVCHGVHEQVEAPERLVAAAARDDRGWGQLEALVQPGVRRLRE